MAGSSSSSSLPQRARRISFKRPVHVRELGQPGPLRRSFAANLSQSGMFVRSPRPLPPGTRVEVFLEARGRILPFAEAVVAFALPREQAAARGRLPGNGLTFTHLPPRSRLLVRELLRRFPWRRPTAAPAPRPAATAAAPHPAAVSTGGWARGALAAVALAGLMTAIALARLPLWLTP